MVRMCIAEKEMMRLSNACAYACIAKYHLSCARSGMPCGGMGTSVDKELCLVFVIQRAESYT